MKIRRFYLPLIMLAAILVSCSSNESETPPAGLPTDDPAILGAEQDCTAVLASESGNSGGGIIAETIRLTRMSVLGELTEIGVVSVPFLQEEDAFYFLNILADLDQDGMWDTTGPDEWVVTNQPILITETTHAGYFPISDPSLNDQTDIVVRVVASEEPIQPVDMWDCGVPDGALALDLQVSLNVIDTEILADPAEGFFGGAYCSPNSVFSVIGPPAQDLNLETIFYRPGVPDIDQGRNTCVGHSMANSLSWLAQQHGFTDKFQQAKDTQGNELDTYDVTTAEGANEMAWEMISDWSDKGQYSPNTGVSSDAIISGKQSFIDKRGLPVTVEQIGSDSGEGTFDAIKQALKEGCDVEVGLKIETENGLKGHMVTVVGFSDIMIGDTPYRGITFRDPGTSSETAGPSGGNDLYEYDPNTNSISGYPFQGKLRKVRLAFAVKECYTPPKVSLNGTYGVGIQVALDTARHAIHILMSSAMDLAVRQSEITFQGPFPWVNVVGTVEEDGSFFASGRGTVAGFTGIAVTFQGTITFEELVGDYTMGAEGGLPTGAPIVYHVEGTRSGPLEDNVASEGGKTLVEAFFDRFNANFSAQSSEGLFFLLHPAVIDLYGAEACQAYLEGVVENVIQVAVLSSTGPDLWQWEIDERTTAIEGAFTVTANVIVGGTTNQSELHIADDENGLLKWFTDCGDPLT